MSHTQPEEVRRSPLSHEIVEPDTRTQVEKMIDGRRNHTRCDSPQVYHNNELSEHPVVEAERNDPDRLFVGSTGRRLRDEPNLAIVNEKPEHRIILYLKAQGLSNKEVAEKTGHTQAWLSQVTRQPWFRLRLSSELKAAGVDQLQSVLKATALDSIFTLIDMRDDVTVPKAVRRACADSLLDRWLGKPTQKIETDDGKRLPSSPEIQALNKELETIETQLKEDTDGGPTTVSGTES